MMDLFSCVFPLLCNIFANQTNVADQKFDFIIVGGGTAGSVLAGRLSENSKVKVLLLEAGGSPPFATEIPGLASLAFTPEYAWLDKTTPQTDAFRAYPNQQPNYIRGKMLGGSSSLNGMINIRGNKNDYNHWSLLGNKGWSFQEILPYFLVSEGLRESSLSTDTTYHNTTGPLTTSYAPYLTQSLDAFLQSAQENGYQTRDLNAKLQTGAMRTLFTMRNGSRCSTAKAYLLPAQHRPNLVIACNSRVKSVHNCLKFYSEMVDVLTGKGEHFKFKRYSLEMMHSGKHTCKKMGKKIKILLNGFPKRASGVTFNHNGTDYYVSASKEVIVSAGAIDSPKLLLLSGIGPKDQLKKFKIEQEVDLQGVGKNLHDHVGTGALVWTVNCTNCTIDMNKYLSQDLPQWMASRDGPLSVPFAIEGIAFTNNDLKTGNKDWPIIRLMFGTSNKPLSLGASYGISNETLATYLGPEVAKFSFMIFTSLLRPKSRGTVELQSGDYRDSPLIDFRYLTDPYDIKKLVEGIKTAIAIGNSKAFQRLGAKLIPRKFPGCENYQQFSDAYLECIARQYTTVHLHPVGTCKMGVASDSMAVVNSELKVHKVKKLRIVDASIMPDIVSGNTNIPVIMIAEKAADMVKKAHGC